MYAGLMGHHLDEYQHMFDLQASDCETRLLEYCCGVTAVNAEQRQKQRNMVSCDPWFSMEKETLMQKAVVCFEEALADIKANMDGYNFKKYGGFEAFVEARRQGLQQGLADYSQGIAENRYLPVDGVCLPFEDFAFDFAVCTQYFFSENEDKNTEMYIQEIRELARVAKEVRIFPLLDRFGQPSRLLGPVLLALQPHYGVEIREVNVPLQIGGVAMLRVWARECQV